MHKRRTHHLVIRFLLFLLVVAVLLDFTATRQASATIVVSLSLEDLARQADVVVQGTCEEISSDWDTEHERIFTYITVLPERCLKGECPSPVRIRKLGGSAGNITMTVAGTPKFSLGEEVLLFLRKSSASYYQVLGLSQGKFSVIRRGKTLYVARDVIGLTLVKKRGGQIQLEPQKKLERETNLEAFIMNVESYLLEK